MTSSSTDALKLLLKQRINLIADHAFRDRDPAAHLAALQKVSEEITSTYAAVKPQLMPRLRHYMEQASYSKALDFLEGEKGES